MSNNDSPQHETKRKHATPTPPQSVSDFMLASAKASEEEQQQQHKISPWQQKQKRKVEKKKKLAEDWVVTTYKVSHVESWSEGSKLFYEVVDQKKERSRDSSDDSSDLDAEEIEVEESERMFRVYHLKLDVGNCHAVFLAQFSTREDAEFYAKQQFTLYCGDYPQFVSDKKDEDGRRICKRTKLYVPDDAACALGKSEDNHDCYPEYLIICRKDLFDAHPLGPSEIW